jgi:hypothetical protein
MDDAEATAASLLGLATVAYSRAEYTPALASYREALAIYEKREEGASIGRTLVSVGNVQYLQAEYDEATASYRRALNLLVAGMDPQGAAFARNVPDDLLWRVPFEALLAGEGDLSSQARVTYATSLATLAVQRSVAEATAPPGHLVAGIAAAPAIPAAIRAQAALTSQGWKEPAADASLAAAREIAKVYGDAATLRTGADATEAAVRALLETSDIVHVLAPLQISGPTPLFSSLLLGGSVDTLENDGRWEAREWFNLDGRARVMVIPDASTFGVAGVGGAMDAFAWAAAAAKVSFLVIGRWPGDGFAPEAFLSALHAQLAKGVPVGEAWRAATVSTRENAGAAPAGWAGLRLIGGG